MSEENKNEEVKNSESENTTKEEKVTEKEEKKVEETKPEEKTSEVKEEKVEATETKMEEAKVEEKATETKEEKKEPVKLVEAKPTVKEKKKFPWKPVGIVAGAIVLSLTSGVLGGYVGGKVMMHQLEQEVEEMFQPSTGIFGFGGNGNNSNGGSFGGFELPEEQSDTPALGITVQKTDESNLVIAGFADGSNGEEQGLQVGDIITKVDGKDVTSADDIASILEDFKIGDDITVTVTRDGKEVEAKITLIQKTNTFSFQTTPNNNGNSSNNGFPEDDGEKVQG